MEYLWNCSKGTAATAPRILLATSRQANPMKSGMENSLLAVAASPFLQLSEHPSTETAWNDAYGMAEKNPGVLQTPLPDVITKNSAYGRKENEVPLYEMLSPQRADSMATDNARGTLV